MKFALLLLSASLNLSIAADATRAVCPIEGGVRREQVEAVVDFTFTAGPATTTTDRTGYAR